MLGSVLRGFCVLLPLRPLRFPRKHYLDPLPLHFHFLLLHLHSLHVHLHFHFFVVFAGIVVERAAPVVVVVLVPAAVVVENTAPAAD